VADRYAVLARLDGPGHLRRTRVALSGRFARVPICRDQRVGNVVVSLWSVAPTYRQATAFAIGIRPEVWASRLSG